MKTCNKKYKSNPLESDSVKKMKSKDWHVKDFDINSGSFDDLKRLVYYDLETFADEEEEKLKEKERLESEQKDKEHIIELKKLKIAEKELDIDSDQQFLRGLRPFFLILASFLVMAILFILFKHFHQNINRNRDRPERRRTRRRSDQESFNTSIM